jgi:sodium-dependent phosphate transporter
MVLQDYTYLFAIGTLFAMLDAYNNGASESTNSAVVWYRC